MSLSQSTQNCCQNEPKVCAPNQMFRYGSNYYGRSAAPPRSLAKGATVVKWQPSIASHKFNKKVEVVNGFIAPRFPCSSKLVLPELNQTQSVINVQTLPYTPSFSYGNFYIGTDCVTNSPFSPFSNTGTSYTGTFEDANIPKLTFSPGTVVGNDRLLLGGVLSLSDHFHQGPEYKDLSRFIVKAKEQANENIHGATDVLRSLNELENEPGVCPHSGYGVPCNWPEYIRCRASVNIDPPESCEMKRTVFTIKSGTKWPGDYSIKDNCTDRYITNPTLPHDCSCSSQEYPDSFLHDWIFDSDKYTIVESILLSRNDNEDLSVVSFEQGASIHYSVSVITTIEYDYSSGNPNIDSLCDALADGSLNIYLCSGTGQGVHRSDEFPPASNMLVADESDRGLLLFGPLTSIPAHTYCSVPFTLETGMRVDGPVDFGVATEVVAPSNLTYPNNDPESCSEEVRVHTAQSRWVFGHSIFDNNFVFEGNYIFEQIVCEQKSIRLPCGAYTLTPFDVPYSASWREFCLENAFISPEHVLSAPLLFNKTQGVPSELECGVDTVLAKESCLAPRTLTADGMKPTRDVRCEEGTLIQSLFALFCPLTTTSPKDFIVDTIFGKNTVLPVETRLSNGNTTPSPLAITTSHGVTLAPGSKLCKPILQSNFTVNSGSGFEADFEIPQNSTVSEGAVLLSETVLPAGFKAPFCIPLPPGVVFDPHCSIQVGTIFGEGVSIPRIAGKPQQDLTNCDFKNKGFLFVTLNNKNYLVLKSGSTLIDGFHLPKGSVLLASNNMGGVSINNNITSFNCEVYKDDKFVKDPCEEGITLFPSDYNVDSRGSCGTGSDKLVIEVGCPTSVPIYTTVDIILKDDMAIPWNDSPSTFERILFNVPFKIITEVKPECPYLVDGENSVFHAAGKDLNFDIRLSTDFTVPTTFILTKKILVPGCHEEFVTGMLQTKGSFIRFPPVTTRTHKNILIGPEGLEISSGGCGSRSGLTLPTGNVISTTGCGITLQQPLTVESDWRILVDLHCVPALTIYKLVLPAGSSLPADVNLPAGSPLPAGLHSCHPIELLEDYTITSESSPFKVVVDSVLAERTILSTGSKIVDGLEAKNVSYGPVSCWSKNGELILAVGHHFDSSFKFCYFNDAEPISIAQDSDTDRLKDAIVYIESQLVTIKAFDDTTEDQLAQLKSDLANLKQQLADLKASCHCCPPV